MSAMDLDEPFKRAASLFAEKQFERSMKAYEEVLRCPSAPMEERVRAMNNISACYAALQQYSSALEKAKQAIEMDPCHPQALYRAAVSHEGLRQYEDAEALLRKALSIKPGHPPYRDALRRVEQARRPPPAPPAPSEEKRRSYYYEKSLKGGTAAMKEKNFSEAIRLFTKALDLVPPQSSARDRATLYANRSAAHLKSSALEESLADATLSAATDPTYPRAPYRIACALEALRRYAEASEAAKTCLALEMGHEEAAALLQRVEPIIQQSRKTQREIEASESERLRELQERKLEERSAMPALLSRSRAVRSSHSYCTFCNEHGHTREECELLRAQRRRYH